MLFLSYRWQIPPFPPNLNLVQSINTCNPISN
ncbi:hypothetical protein LINPERPRIM_LOCUS42475 [Linum perenne]